MRQAGLFGLSGHLKRLSANGDPLEILDRVLGFESFRSILMASLAYGDGSRGGRPAYAPVVMLKVLILAAQNNVSDGRMEYLIRDRLSWLRFLDFELGAPTPDANTIRLFREKLTAAEALDALFIAFDRQLKERGALAMGGRIVDAALVAAPKQRNAEAGKAAIEDGKTAASIGPDKPARAAQKAADARWTLKFAKGRPAADGKPGIDIAIPSFGYKSSLSICRIFGFIRKGKVTGGTRFDGRMLRDVATKDNTASDVWVGTAYRSQSNAKWLKAQGRVSRIHRKKPKGKPMPERIAKANAVTSKVRARIEQGFAQRKDTMGLFVRTIGIKRRPGQDHAGQSGLHDEPLDLPPATGGFGIAAPKLPEIHQKLATIKPKSGSIPAKANVRRQKRSDPGVVGGGQFFVDAHNVGLLKEQLLRQSTKFRIVPGRRAWQEVLPFFAFPKDVRRIVYPTNALEALNSKRRRAVARKGPFPLR